MMDQLDSLDSSRSLQTRSVISFVINLHLILQMLKILLQKPKNVKYKGPVLITPHKPRKHKKTSYRMFQHIHGVLNEVYLQNFLHGLGQTDLYS